MTIAFIGLGLMGRPMAATLAAAGYKVIGFNRSQVEPPAGVALVSDVAEALRDANTIFVMLTDGPACESVLLDEAVRPLLAGKQVVNSSTISPEQSRTMEAAVSNAGGHYLESPVLGSIPEARSGSLQIMVGGQEADYHAVLPLLKVLGKPTYIGSVGQAAALKLALNQLIGSLTAAFALSLGLVQREGVSVDSFMQILRESALYAPTFDKKLARMLDRQFDNPNFPLKHLLKDLRLFVGAASRSGLATHQMMGLQHLLERGMENGLADKDYSALYNEIVPPDQPIR